MQALPETAVPAEPHTRGRAWQRLRPQHGGHHEARNSNQRACASGGRYRAQCRARRGNLGQPHGHGVCGKCRRRSDSGAVQRHLRRDCGRADGFRAGDGVWPGPAGDAADEPAGGGRRAALHAAGHPGAGTQACTRARAEAGQAGSEGRTGLGCRSLCPGRGRAVDRDGARPRLDHRHLPCVGECHRARARRCRNPRRGARLRSAADRGDHGSGASITAR